MTLQIAETTAGPITGGGTLLEGGADTIAKIISAGVGIMTVIAGIYFLFIILAGAIGIISSGGDKGAYEEGRKKITAGAIGFTIAIAAIFILGLLATILDIPTFLDVGQIENF